MSEFFLPAGPADVKPVGVALSGDQMAALLADRALAARLNASGLRFAVAGIDLVDPAIPRSGAGTADGAVESRVAAATLARWTPDLGWLAVAADHRDHPHRRARCLASVDIALVDPLTASPQRPSVLAWRVGSTGEAAAARGATDIVIWPADRPERLAAVAAAIFGGPQLFLEMPAGGSDLGARLEGHLADERVAGVILRPAGGETGLREFIARVLPGLAGSGTFRTGWPGMPGEPLASAFSAPFSEPTFVLQKLELRGPAWSCQDDTPAGYTPRIAGQTRQYLPRMTLDHAGRPVPGGVS